MIGLNNTMFTTDCISIKDIRPGLKSINVVFIVLDVGASTVTKENREVRTFKVADATASINFVLFLNRDEPLKLLIPGDIVRLTKGYASIWRQCLTLYSGKNGDIHRIGDFCLTFNEQLNMSEPNPNLAVINQSPIILNNGTSNNGTVTTNRTITGGNGPSSTTSITGTTTAAAAAVATGGPTGNNGSGTSTNVQSKTTRLSGEQQKSSPKNNPRGARSSNSRNSNIKSDRR